jgi:hypothetical protein
MIARWKKTKNKCGEEGEKIKPDQFRNYYFLNYLKGT